MEEKYRDMEEANLRLRDENTALKKKKNEQEVTIKKMYTKLSMIEENLKRKKMGEDNQSPAVQPPPKRDVDVEKYIASLTKENAELRRRNKCLIEKYRQLSSSKLQKKNSTNLKPIKPNQSHSHVVVPLDNNQKEDEVMQPSHSIKELQDHQSLHDLIDVLRNRLVVAERQLTQLQKENHQMRQSHEVFPQDNNQEVENVQRTLKDRQAQLVILQTRYENLETKSKAEREIQQQTLQQMEVFNRTIRDLRRQLQDEHGQREEMQLRAAKCRELEIEIKDLQEQNYRLEAKMTSLCESPFINDAFLKKERIDRLIELERLDHQQKDHIKQLQETVEKQKDTILELQKKISKLKKEKEENQDEIKRLNSQLQELLRLQPNNIENNKPTTQEPTPEVAHHEWESAMTYMTKINENPSHVDFLENNLDDSKIELRRKIHTLQIAHLDAIRELERCERMLKAQTNINRDLTLEIEELVKEKKSSIFALETKLEEYDKLAGDRLNKIKSLEEIVKSLQYKNHEGGSLPCIDNELASMVNHQEILELETGENMLEVWIIDGHFDEESLDCKSCTFVICDFYDFESQTTPLAIGYDPVYNMATSYKVVVDEFFIKYLATENLILEVHQTRKGDFELIGHCTISLKGLLNKKPPSITFPNQPIHSTVDGKVLGSLNCKLKLATSICELWKMYSKSHPQDKNNIHPGDKGRKTMRDSNLLIEADRRTMEMNEIQITVIGCQGLPCDYGDIPSPYVHYQLLSFPDCFTPIVEDTSNPMFEHHTHTYSVHVDKTIVSLLNKMKLQFTVFDDKDSNNSPDGMQGVIGISSIPLKALCNGDPVSGSFEIRDGTKNRCGYLQVTIQWKYPQKILLEGKVGISELTSNQLYTLMKNYSPIEDGSVNYLYFLKDASTSVFAENLVEHFQATCQKISNDKNIRQMLGVHEKEEKEIFWSLEDVRTALKILGIDMLDEDVKLFFETLDLDGDQKVSIHQFLSYSKPTLLQEQILQQKIRRRIRSYMETNAFHPIEIFQKYDLVKEGFLSRREFKHCLTLLGFSFYSETSIQKEEISTPTTKRTLPEKVSFETDDVIDSSTIDPIPSKPRHDATVEFENRKKQFDLRMRKAVESNKKSIINDLRQTTMASQSTMPFQSTMASQTIMASQSTMPCRAMTWHDKALPLSTSPVSQEFQRKRHAAACTLQKKFRGYQSSKNLEHFSKPEKPSMEWNIVQAETVFRECWDCQILTLLQNAFLVVDRQALGLVSRKQFAHAISQIPSLVLKTPLLRCFMDYFTIQQNGANIHYGEFLSFANYSPVKPPLVIKTMEKMNLDLADVIHFQNLDLSKVGSISRQDFVCGLYKTGHRLSKTITDTIMDIFDIDGDGLIAYPYFVHYIALQPSSLAIQTILQKMRGSLQKIIKRGENSIMVLFSRFDQDQDHYLEKSEFISALNHGGFQLSSTEIHNLFQRFEIDNRVGYSDLVRLLEVPQVGSYYNQSVGDLGILQKLGGNMIRHQIMGESNSLETPFNHYDWKKIGTVGIPEFHQAVKDCGFPFTETHLGVLADQFKEKNSSLVNYHCFLDWLMPVKVDARIVILRLREVAEKVAETRNTEISHVLNDWLLTFSHDDTLGNGTISRYHFKLGCQNLKLPLNQEEIRKLMNLYDPKREDKVDYCHFLKLDPKSKSNLYHHSTTINHTTTNQPSHQTLEDVLLAIRTTLAQLSKWKTSEFSMDFHQLDVHHSGKLDAKVFFTQLKRFGIELKENDASLLMSSFGDQGKKIKYKEFLASIFHLTLEEIQQSMKNLDRNSKQWKFLNLLCQDGVYLQKSIAKEKLCALAHQQGLLSQDVSCLFEKHHLHEKHHLYELNTRQFYESVLHMDSTSFSHFNSNPLSPIQPSNSLESNTKKFSCTTRLSEITFQKLQHFFDNCVHRGIDYRFELELHDVHCSGEILMEKFQSCLRNMGLLLEDERWKEIYNAYWVHEGSISLTSLLFQFRLPQLPIKVWNLQEQLRNKIRKKAYPYIQLSNLDIPFHHFDRLNSDKIVFKDLCKGVQHLGINSSDTTLQHLFDLIDLGKKSYLSKNDFRVFVCDANHFEVERKLLKFRPKYHELQKKLQEYDPQGSGKVSSKVFHHCLESIDIIISSSDLRRLSYRFDVFNDTNIAYLSFLELMMDPKKKENISSSSLSSSSLSSSFRVHAKEKTSETTIETSFCPPSSTLAFLLHQLEDIFESVPHEKRMQIYDLFDHLDVEGKGFIDKEEFLLGMKKLGFPMTMEQCNLVLQHYRMDTGNKINYHDMIQKLTRKTRSKTWIMSKIKTLLANHENQQKIQQCFQHFDVDQCGYIDQDEFRLGLKRLGLQATMDEIQEILQSYTEKENQIAYQQFLNEMLPRLENNYKYTIPRSPKEMAIDKENLNKNKENSNKNKQVMFVEKDIHDIIKGFQGCLRFSVEEIERKLKFYSSKNDEMVDADELLCGLKKIGFNSITLQEAMKLIQVYGEGTRIHCFKVARLLFGIRESENQENFDRSLACIYQELSSFDFFNIPKELELNEQSLRTCLEKIGYHPVSSSETKSIIDDLGYHGNLKFRDLEKTIENHRFRKEKCLKSLKKQIQRFNISFDDFKEQLVQIGKYQRQEQILKVALERLGIFPTYKMEELISYYQIGKGIAFSKLLDDLYFPSKENNKTSFSSSFQWDGYHNNHYNNHQDENTTSPTTINEKNESWEPTSYMDELREHFKLRRITPVEMLDSFVHFDTEKCGVLDEYEFQLGMKRLGIHLTKEKRHALLMQYGDHERMQYRSFIKTIFHN